MASNYALLVALFFIISSVEVQGDCTYEGVTYPEGSTIKPFSCFILQCKGGIVKEHHVYKIRSTCVGPCIYYLSGHIWTGDEQHYSINQPCCYKMIGNDKFRIDLCLKKCGTYIPNLMCIDSVKITIGLKEAVIDLDQAASVKYNGIGLTLTVAALQKKTNRGNKIILYIVNNDIMIMTDQVSARIVTKNSKIASVSVYVPQSIKNNGNIDGMCGNYNGNKLDDVCGVSDSVRKDNYLNDCVKKYFAPPLPITCDWTVGNIAMTKVPPTAFWVKMFCSGLSVVFPTNLTNPVNAACEVDTYTIDNNFGFASAEERVFISYKEALNGLATSLNDIDAGIIDDSSMQCKIGNTFYDQGHYTRSCFSLLCLYDQLFPASLYHECCDVCYIRDDPHFNVRGCVDNGIADYYYDYMGNRTTKNYLCKYKVAVIGDLDIIAEFKECGPFLASNWASCVGNVEIRGPGYIIQVNYAIFTSIILNGNSVTLSNLPYNPPNTNFYIWYIRSAGSANSYWIYIVFENGVTIIYHSWGPYIFPDNWRALEIRTLSSLPFSGLCINLAQAQAGKLLHGDGTFTLMGNPPNHAQVTCITESFTHSHLMPSADQDLEVCKTYADATIDSQDPDCPTIHQETVDKCIAEGIPEGPEAFNCATDIDGSDPDISKNITDAIIENNEEEDRQNNQGVECLFDGTSTNVGDTSDIGCYNFKCVAENKFTLTSPSTNENCKICSIRNDPHFVTYMGVKYSYHGGGDCWYSLTQEDVVQTFKFGISNQFRPCGKAATCIGDTEFRVDQNTKISITYNDPFKIKVVRNGQPTTMTVTTTPQLGPGNKFLVWKSPSGTLIIAAAGLTMQYTYKNGMRTHMSILTEPGLEGLIYGLCGKFDKTLNNDLIKRNGDEAPLPPKHGTNYYEFGDDWRILPCTPARADTDAQVAERQCSKKYKMYAKKRCNQIIKKINLEKDDHIAQTEFCEDDICAMREGGMSLEEAEEFLQATKEMITHDLDERSRMTRKLERS